MIWIHLAIILWLAVCAVQDLRRWQVSSWLTVPPFVAAGVWAVWHGGATLLLFGMVTLVMLVSFWKGGAGGADGKILAALAVFLPMGFLLAVILQGLVAAWLWMRHGKGFRFPVVPVFAAGAVLSLPISIFLQGGF